jgi:septum site-determining protein MinD
MMSVDDVIDILSVNLLGVIPEDVGIITSTNKGEPIVNDENSQAGQAYMNVARRITGEEVPFMDLDAPKTWIDKFKRFFMTVAK